MERSTERRIVQVETVKMNAMLKPMRSCLAEGAVGRGKIRKGYVDGVDRKDLRKKRRLFSCKGGEISQSRVDGVL